MREFDPREFVNKQIEEIRETIGSERALIAVSGGIDSTTCAVYQPPIKNLVALQAKIVAGKPSLTRILYAVQEKSLKQPYVVAIRAVQTRDFLTARVAEVPWATLRETAQKVLKACPNVSSVYYDVTPKPPATIEME
ncbi:MAG: hypothetical protein ACE5OW_01415 [Candidatus Bathyarchaeia archaeon]